MATLVHSHGGPGASHPAQWQFLLLVETGRVTLLPTRRYYRIAPERVLIKHAPITTSSDIYYARFSVVSNRTGEESIFYLLSSYRPLKAQEPFYVFIVLSEWLFMHRPFHMVENLDRAGPGWSNGSYYQNTRRNIVNFSYCKNCC